MLTPRYFFTNDFALQGLFPITATQKEIAYQARLVKSGNCSNESTISFPAYARTIEHETGHRKIISFHGPGTVFPGYHEKDYKIEGSLCTIALTPMEVWEFSKRRFPRHVPETTQPSALLSSTGSPLTSNPCSTTVPIRNTNNPHRSG